MKESKSYPRRMTNTSGRTQGGGKEARGTSGRSSTRTVVVPGTGPEASKTGKTGHKTEVVKKTKRTPTNIMDLNNSTFYGRLKGLAVSLFEKVGPERQEELDDLSAAQRKKKKDDRKKQKEKGEFYIQGTRVDPPTKKTTK